MPLGVTLGSLTPVEGQKFDLMDLEGRGRREGEEKEKVEEEEDTTNVLRWISEELVGGHKAEYSQRKYFKLLNKYVMN